MKDFGVGGQLSGSSFGNKKYSTGTSNGSHYTGSSAGTLQVLVGKLQGLFSNIVGAGGELAFKKASEVGWKKFSSELEKTEKKWSTTVESKLAAGLGGGGKVTCTVRTTGSTVVKDKDKQDRNMVSKPDVEVIVTNNKVTIKYGASVKRYKANRDGVVQSVNLVAGSTTFLAALEQYCGGSKSTLNYVYNVAGGREGKSARSDKHIRASRRSVSLSELVDKWNDIRDCVVMSNFLHYLSGLENASSLFLVVNKQVYPVTDLLTKISANNVKASLWWKNVNGAGQEIGPRKMFTRKRMYVSNQWKGGKPRTHHDNDLAEARSQEAKSEIYSLLASVKLDVTLKDFATLCKS